jgi:hypothetical protein
VSAYPVPPNPAYGYQPPYPPPPQPQKSGCSFTNCLLVVLLVLIVSCCCIVLVGGGGYYLYTSGKVTQNDILRLVGLANGSVEVLNLSDNTLNAALEELEPKPDQTPVQKNISLAPYEMDTLVSKPGKYRLTIEFASNREECTLQITSGDQYNIVGMLEGVVISRKGFSAASSGDLDLKTSPLCIR